MHVPRRRTDLAAFLAVLVTGVVLILCGVKAETVSTVAIGLSTLYAAWQRQEGAPRDPDARDAPGPHPPDSGDRTRPER
ncbi:hypothetical protein [Streptomyces spectabilis]|uniref:Uncharacterized protein n=1 Tax=Streptomyces spectabilis TaxID=68270 RepID=A0A516RIB2_STRST|nr:hypothetical protein [Streptomyces spectabilis]QDQ15400.1 hypothetical protein FH965_36575 [Streptomyces spectabilis]